MKQEKTAAESGIACLGFLLVMFILSFWTDRNLDFWLSHFKGQPVHCPFWMSVIVTILGNGVILLANVLGEVCRLCV